MGKTSLTGSNISSQRKWKKPGANPTTLSYNASVVINYSATKSKERFYDEIIFLRRKNTLAFYNAGVVAVNSLGLG
jgi:hypothetical protein